MVLEGPGTETTYNGVEWNCTGWNSGQSGRAFSGHLTTMNILYMDGHVKSMKPQNAVSPVNQCGRGGGSACGAFTNDQMINCTLPEEPLISEMAALSTTYQ